MKPDPLHELIHSLSMSERRYFTLFSTLYTRKGTKNYLRLFEVLDGMPEYDGQKVIAAFEGESVEKYLSSEKNYLYRLLMKSLRAYRAESTPEIRLQEELQNLEILEVKGLYGQYQKTLKKARKLARKLEDPYRELILLEKELKWRLLSTEKKLEEEVEKLIGAQANRVAQIESSNRVLALNKRNMVLARKAGKSALSTGWKLSAEELASLRNLSTSLLTPRARLQRESLYFMYAWSNGKAKNAFDHARKVVKLWEQNPVWIQKEPNGYKVAMANLLGAAFRIQEFDGFPGLLEKFKALPSAGFAEEAEMFQNVFFYDLIRLMNTGDLPSAINLIPKIEEGLERYASHINKTRELGFYYNISILYFFKSNWKSSRRWVRKITEHSKTEHRQDIQQFASWLELVLLAEEKAFDLLEYRIPSVLRGVKKGSPGFVYKQILGRCILAMLDQATANLSKAEWKKHFQAFSTFQDQQETPPPLGVSELYYWMKGKLHGISPEAALLRFSS